MTEALLVRKNEHCTMIGLDNDITVLSGASCRNKVTLALALELDGCLGSSS